jgi:hypothetical protein
MRIATAALLLALFASAPAQSEILHARPDLGGAPGARYRWGSEVVLDSMPLKAAIAVAKAANGSRPLEIRLLHAMDAPETLYTVELGSFRSALRWAGSENAKLVIRGQLDNSEPTPRALTVLAGRPLTQTVCDLAGVDVCGAAPEPDAVSKGPPPNDLLNRVGEELDRSEDNKKDRAAPDVHFRLDCFLFYESAFVEVTDTGFRDCWFAAVASYASSNIALRNSIVHGSTWAFLAVGKKGIPESAHSFEVTHNLGSKAPQAIGRARLLARSAAIGPVPLASGTICRGESSITTSGAT